MPKVRVVEIHSSAIGDNPITLEEARKMIAAGLDHLSPTGIGRDLLENIFTATDIVGIKVNALAGKQMSTSPALAFALAEAIAGRGVKKANVIIWDRREAELKRAGFDIKTSGADFRCLATDTPGVGFSGKLSANKSIGSMFSRIQTEMISAAVNFAVLKDHSLAGLSGCLKNYYGVIHNPNKYHDNLCDPYLADLYEMAEVKGKQRLAIIDASRIQYNGGPGYVERWKATYGSLLLSLDAVAVDRVAYAIVDLLRTKAGLPLLKDAGREPIHIRTAGKADAGCADMNNIEWVVVNL